jgi:hypothetical protein
VNVNRRIAIDFLQWAKVPVEDEQAATVTLEYLTSLEDELSQMNAALKKMDEWQGKQTCYGSIYNIEDDEFGKLQFFIHDTMATLGELLNEAGEKP